MKIFLVVVINQMLISENIKGQKTLQLMNRPLWNVPESQKLKDDISRVVLSGIVLEWTWPFLKSCDE